MTEQVSDALVVDGVAWSIAHVDGDGWWTPEAHGLETSPPSTACWRGYVARFGIVRGRLSMTALHICFRRPDGAPEGPTLVAIETVTSIEAGRFVLTDGALCTIGSADDVELRLEHPDVAPRHALVALKGTLRDAGIALPNPVQTFEVPAGDPVLAKMAARMRPPIVAIDQGSVAGTTLGDDLGRAPPRRLIGAAALEYGSVLHVPGHRVFLWSSPSPSGPAMFGVVPTYEDGFSVYRWIDVPVAFTGRVLLGSGRIDAAGQRPGPRTFERSLELSFDDGCLVGEHA
ncbi:hypothetical protein L6R52_06650 [Myxococcota bacterium]|nr:hypothetical protein [Myxococcota bacterium]